MFASSERSSIFALAIGKSQSQSAISESFDILAHSSIG